MFEIYTYGGGDFLRLIFNGIAQIFGNADYIVAIKSAALIGLMSFLLNAASQKGRLDFQWLLGIIMIYMVAIVPKTEIIINDQLIPANSAVVENVPIGISVTSSVFSRLSYWLTTSFETVFSLPNQVKYTGNGLMFAQTLVEESTRFEFTTPRIASNFTEFWKSCVYYDLLLRLYTWNDLLKTSDLVTFLKERTAQARAFSYEPEKGPREITTCRVGFNQYLLPELEQEIKNSTNIQASRLIPNETIRTEAISRFESTMPVAYSFLTKLSMKSSEIISQNILSNSFKRGLMSFASDADASAAAEDFAMARAESERRTTFSVMGKLAKKFLPILHHIFESVIYAIFPIVMIMAMLPSAGAVLKRYCMALFWVNLWPPLYCLLHFASSYYGQKAASAAMVQTGHGFQTGLSIMTNTGLGHVLSDYAAITGYLSMSIPMISWLVISASGAVMAGLAGRIIEDYDRPVSGAASEATSGNISLGNFNYQNQSAFQASTAPQASSGMMSFRGEDGIQTTVTTQGHYMDAPSSSIPFSINYNDSISGALKESQYNAISQTQSTSVEQAQSTGFLLSQKNALVDHINQTKSYAQSLSASDQYTLAHSSEKTQNLLNQWAKNEGLSERSVNAIRAAIEGSGGVGGKINIAKLGANINGQLAKSKEYMSDEQIGKAIEFINGQQFSDAARQESSAVRDIFRRMDSSKSHSLDQSLTKALDQHEQASKRHSESLAHLEQISKQNEFIRQETANLNQNGTDQFLNWMVTHKGIPETETRKLIGDFNQGLTSAKKEVSELQNEFAKSTVEELSLKWQKMQTKDSLDNHFQQFQERINSKMPSMNEVKWSDQENFDHFEKIVGDKIQTHSDLMKNDKELIDNSGEKLKTEYDTRKNEDENSLF